jgi:hypothetical protein
LGLGSIGLSDNDFWAIILTAYIRAISTGFELDEIDPAVRQAYPALIEAMIEPCQMEPTRYQLVFDSFDQLQEFAWKGGWKSDEQQKVLWQLFEAKALSPQALRLKLEEFAPDFNSLFSNWQLSALRTLSLTSVGMVVGHANAKRCGIPMEDLTTWIK